MMHTHRCAHLSALLRLSSRAPRLRQFSSTSPAVPSGPSRSDAAVTSSSTPPAAVPPTQSHFSGAITSWGNPNVVPRSAPVSNAPVRVERRPSQPGARKTAEEYIAEVPVVEVDSDTALCDGGDPLMGHPLVYLQLNKVRPDQPTTCGYCGIRYVRAHGSHHGAH